MYTRTNVKKGHVVMSRFLGRQVLRISSPRFATCLRYRNETYETRVREIDVERAKRNKYSILSEHARTLQAG